MSCQLNQAQTVTSSRGTVLGKATSSVVRCGVMGLKISTSLPLKDSSALPLTEFEKCMAVEPVSKEDLARLQSQCAVLSQQILQDWTYRNPKLEKCPLCRRRHTVVLLEAHDNGSEDYRCHYDGCHEHEWTKPRPVFFTERKKR